MNVYYCLTLIGGSWVLEVDMHRIAYCTFRISDKCNKYMTLRLTYYK